MLAAVLATTSVPPPFVTGADWTAPLALADAAAGAPPGAVPAAGAGVDCLGAPQATRRARRRARPNPPSLGENAAPPAPQFWGEQTGRRVRSGAVPPALECWGSWEAAWPAGAVLVGLRAWAGDVERRDRAIGRSFPMAASYRRPGAQAVPRGRRSTVGCASMHRRGGSGRRGPGRWGARAARSGGTRRGRGGSAGRRRSRAGGDSGGAAGRRWLPGGCVGRAARWRG